MSRGRVASLALLTSLLMGCQANDDSISQFIAQAHEKAQADVEPLAEQSAFVAEAFVMTSSRVPFLKPRPERGEPVDGETTACWQPAPRKQQSPLESFPLGQLSMRGVMGDNNQLWGLVYTPEGKLIKVREGYYLGLNHGKILKVSPKSIDIEEILPDGEGCWLKRPMKLTLVKQDKAV
ncbi:pilus assembly protein PilP [Photobacterium aphoticum]|uniref:Pilus assembly protein PilQ n=1 Tax=Photobacterium aphoticum TaxID=754436 RepID=A0A0J1GJ74_9GAMM|nr:pilus assembly protein PilP [Photobacterium aphoticum]KLU99620.1 pilus assembly protein PilQ [Photobacterium aphoticum]PSU54812.1 pilus assembly protein PilQ [Photobacterium aphoticum]